jgi:serine/threonine-protein kinase/serine/threonine-protein kinase PpkA
MQRILLIEGTRQITDAVQTALDERFPDHQMDFLLSNDLPDNVASIDWPVYDFVLVNCPHELDPALGVLCQVKQIADAPIIIVLTRSVETGTLAIQSGADDYFHYESSISELPAKLEAQIELQSMLQQYPLDLTGYKIHDVIHDADNAVIYRALQLAEARTVAIKRFKYVLTVLPTEIIEKLTQSLDKKTQVKHPGVVDIESVGMTTDAFYLIMEYILGADLKQILESHGKPPLPQAIIWFIEITKALAAIHDSGLLHRDLKTSNILLRDDGSLALMDYGVEKSLLIETGFIAEDEIFCTPYYVSPERITGEACTAATDIYSLGIIFYELLMGEKPFDANSLTELMTKHVIESVPELPDDLKHYQAILNGMLEKLPEYRYHHCQDILQDLLQIDSEAA